MGSDQKWTKDEIIEELDREAAGERKTLDGFKERIDHNPVSAFEWSKDAFRAAARFNVIALIKSAVQGNDDVRKAIKIIDRSAERAMIAGLQASSTSVPSNLIERETGIAWHALWLDEEWWTYRGKVRSLIERCPQRVLDDEAVADRAQRAMDEEEADAAAAAHDAKVAAEEEDDARRNPDVPYCSECNAAQPDNCYCAN